jgi:hypothetical protein
MSDVAVRSAKPALRDGVPADRKQHDGRGLYLLIRANGAKHWRINTTWLTANACWPWASIPMSA